MPPGGIRTHNNSGRAAADLRLRPRGHWQRQLDGCFPELDNQPINKLPLIGPFNYRLFVFLSF